MKPIQFRAELWLPRQPAEIWEFFSDAYNLQELTPTWLRFDVITPKPIDLRPGALIDYRIKIRGFPIRWRTEITEWLPPHRFTDVQVRGPYRLWKHTHIFNAENGGTRCIDEVEYWPLGGALANWLFVGADVRRIFAYRQARLRELFP